MVRHPTLLEVVGPDLLGSSTTADLRAAKVPYLRGRSILGCLEQPTAQHEHGLGAVLDLALLVLHGDDDACRQVRDSHGRIGGVDALTTWSA